MPTSLPLLLVAPWISIVDIRQHRIPNVSLLMFWLLIEVQLAMSAARMDLSAHEFAIAILIVGLALHRLVDGAIGMGDIKLFALLALLTHSLTVILTSLTCASIGAGLVALISRKKVVPFAPSLIIAALTVLIA